MEFNDWHFVHFHVVLRFMGKDSQSPVEDIVHRAKGLWRLRGYDYPCAVKHKVVWNAEGLARYLLKSDHQDEVTPQKTWQKQLPEWLRKRGTGCNWWGAVGKKRHGSATDGPFAVPPNAAVAA